MNRSVFHINREEHAKCGLCSYICTSIKYLLDTHAFCVLTSH